MWWIIQEKEKKQRQNERRPFLRVPVPNYDHKERTGREKKEESTRGSEEITFKL